jgi:hypothetical protein
VEISKEICGFREEARVWTLIVLEKVLEKTSRPQQNKIYNITG